VRACRRTLLSATDGHSFGAAVNHHVGPTVGDQSIGTVWLLAVSNFQLPTRSVRKPRPRYVREIVFLPTAGIVCGPTFAFLWCYRTSSHNKLVHQLSDQRAYGAMAMKDCGPQEMATISVAR